MKPSQIPASVEEVVKEHSFNGEGCWTWDGPSRPSGSPIIEADGQQISAKMAFYHFLKGPLKDLADDQMYRFYMGACDNKLCVRPELYSHLIVRECNTPTPKRRNKRKLNKVPWDKERVLRFYYGHDNPEEQFEDELALHHDKICELVNVSLNYFTEGECVTWDSIVTHYEKDTEHGSNDFLFDSCVYRFNVVTTIAMYPLPVKRALWVYWNDKETYFLLNGIHRIYNACGDKLCYAPWHLTDSIRTPGTRNAKTDWVS